MRRLLIGLLFALSASAALAEGPGTRIRSGSHLPRPPQSLPPEKEDACARLRDEEARARCLEQARRPVQTGNLPGPGSVSGTSGAGSSASSGTTGAGSLGAGAPR
jgi:hypothetical protein